MHYILLSQRKKEDAVKHREPNDPPDSCGGESQIQSKYPQPSDSRSADKPQESQIRSKYPQPSDPRSADKPEEDSTTSTLSVSVTGTTEELIKTRQTVRLCLMMAYFATRIN